MSTLSGEITRLRRYLRDPDGNVWSDDLLLDLWAEVSHDLQQRTRVLETATGINIAPSWPASILFEWEWAYMGKSRAHRALRPQQGYTVSAVWETQQYAGLTPSSSETGTMYTHPWEAFEISPAEPPYWPLPHDFGTMRAAYHDREPIVPVRREEIRTDSTWKTHAGEPWAYIPEEGERSFTLYPRPSAKWVDDAGEGPIQYVDGDPDGVLASTAKNVTAITNANPGVVTAATHGFSTGDIVYFDANIGGMTDVQENSYTATRVGDDSFSIGVDTTTYGTYTSGGTVSLVESHDSGTITYGDTTFTSSEGVGLSWVPEDDTIFLYYRQRPPEPQGWGDDAVWPSFLLKYVRYGVLARAYRANTDGRIPSLASFWGERYQIGVKAVERYALNRISAVRRGLRMPRRPQKRLPKLPSTYPQRV